MAPPVETATRTGEEQAKNRGRLFVPGQSGNPKGRPPLVVEIRRVARSHGPWVIERLRQLAEEDDGRVAVLACKELLDRGYGKPSDEIALERPRALFDLSKLTPDEIATLKELRQKMHVADVTETIDVVAVRLDESATPDQR